MISSALRHASATVDATAGRAKSLLRSAGLGVRETRRSTRRLRELDSPVPSQSRIVFRAGVAKCS